jgi:AcrR family transcriptional regulator
MARTSDGVPLSRERILAAALAVADTSGLGEVTMRRVAGELGVEAMSLYHHVSGKEDLLDGVVTVLVGEITAGAEPSGADWRENVRRRCLAAREVMLRHPWAPALLSTRTTVPPSVYLHYEALLAAMIDGGMSYALGHRALHALGSLALGFDRGMFSPTSAGGVDEEAADEEFAALAEALPHLAAMAAAELHDAEDPTLDWCDSQAEFEFTLDLLLDGLARAQQAERPRSAARGR